MYSIKMLNLNILHCSLEIRINIKIKFKIKKNNNQGLIIKWVAYINKALINYSSLLKN